MKKTTLLLAALVMLVAWALPLSAQFKDIGLSGGIQFSGTYGQTELADDEMGYMGRAFIRMPLGSHHFGVELGAGYGIIKGTEYETSVIPIDLRLIIAPFNWERVSPYLYVGAGVGNFSRDKVTYLTPSGAAWKDNYTATPDGLDSKWIMFVPAGIGIPIKLGSSFSIDLNAGYNLVFNDGIEGVFSTEGTDVKPNPDNTNFGKREEETFIEENDAWWNFGLGLNFLSESGTADPDGDGLTNNEEKQLGTDKSNPDTDGDTLKDGAEVKTHSTNPLKADSDGDGLKDNEEIMTHKTNPNKADTDGDGLNDYDEVMKSKTDPLKADSDGDTLNDGAEVNTHKTNPLKSDTDGDGLTDGAEVNTHRTNPLVADTDGGSVNDGTEVTRGTDPKNADDDVPKIKAEVGKAYTLKGVNFKTGSAEILPESEPVLMQAFEALNYPGNKDWLVEIQGHTDNTGRRSTNQKLSVNRANSVKAWLVKKGIDPARISTKGFGPDKPVASNKTTEGRAENRRIEFVRTR
jgi:outer membrane protein OmpA-like peptidoglycan-associated protein